MTDPAVDEPAGVEGHQPAKGTVAGPRLRAVVGLGRFYDVFIPRPHSSLSPEEMALLRATWDSSPERKEARFRIRSYLVFFAGVAVGLTVALLLWEKSFPESVHPSLPPYPWLLWSFLVWGLAGIASISAHALIRSAALDALDDRLTLEKIQKAEAEAASAGDGGALDLAELWALTQQRIDLYHGLATSQSRASFRVGQTVMVLGFVAVISIGALAAFAPNGTAAIAASVVAVASAALSGFVSATFMKSQSEASSQLREFFLQPVEFARLLGAERLVHTLQGEDAKAKAIEQIIKAMAPAPDHPREAKP